MNRLDAWIYARLLSGEAGDDEHKDVSETFRPFANQLAQMPLGERQGAWTEFFPGRSDADELTKAVADADPLGPRPEGESSEPWATAADIRRLTAESRWAWKGWISSNGIMGVAGFEGTGKTRFALDLCRRIHAGDAWPDGQAATFPPETRSLWLCADGHHGELVETMAAFGLPDEAVLLPALASDPYGGTDLDSEETMTALESVVKIHRPGLIVIDTLTNATGKDICSQAVMKGLKAPLVNLCQTHGVLVMLLLHVSKEGQALGRRIKGVTRTLIHLECPDPAKASDRLKAWVEKSFAQKPPPLGVTMTGTGNDYDFTPPTAPLPVRGGRPSDARDKAKAFIVDALTERNDRIGNELACEYKASGGTTEETRPSEKTFWRAVKDLKADGKLTTEGGPGKRKETVLHLIDACVSFPPANPDTGHDQVSDSVQDDESADMRSQLRTEPC